jgi:SSS family solute:Na+ symporter
MLQDYYIRFFRPNASEKESMRVLYFSTILWGTLATMLGLIFVNLAESALDIWWTFAGIFGGGMLGLFLLGQVRRRAGNRSAIIAVLVGIVTIFYFTSPEIINWLNRNQFHNAADLLKQFLIHYCGGVSPYQPNMIPVFGTIIIVLVGFLMTFIMEPKPIVSDKTETTSQKNG